MHIRKVKAIKALIDELPLLQEADIPCFSNAIDKDKIVIGGGTEKVLTDKKVALTNRVVQLQGDGVKMAQWVDNYSKRYNEVCELKYNLKKYRADLRVQQALRMEQVEERVESALEAHENKMSKDSGVYRQNYERKQMLKRKKLGTDETKKPSVFDLL